MLVVSDIDGFAEKGGMIGFTTDTNVRLEINLTAARAAGLAISSKLLRVGRLAGAPTPP